MERTVVLVKPDGLQRGLVGEIIHRFERKGLKLAGIKMICLDDAVLDEWYAHHKDKSFFPSLLLTSPYEPKFQKSFESVPIDMSDSTGSMLP